MQLWISLELKALVKAKLPVSPRLLLAVVGVAATDILFVVGHIPDHTKGEECDRVWDEMCNAVRGVMREFGDMSVVVLVDSNGRVGSTLSPFIGHSDAACEDSNGARLLSQIA